MKNFYILLGAALLALSACNTMQGMGRDVSTAGNAMTDTAQDAENGM
jgi:predicted small secreted protein